MKTQDALAILSVILGIATSLLSLVEGLQKQYARGVPTVWLVAVAIVLALASIMLQWKRPVGVWLRSKIVNFHEAIDRWRPAMILLILLVSLALLIWTTSLVRNANEMARLNAAEYIGNFPDNMERINELVSRAKRRLIVVTDLAAYGAFSAPEEHTNYKLRLEEMKNNEVELSALVYSDEVARGSVGDQFQKLLKETSLSDFLHSELMDRFVEKNGIARPSDEREFLDMVVEKNRIVRENEPFRNVTKCVAGRFPVFLWIRDNEEAVFSFYNLGQESREVSFYTNKPSLVKILIDIYDSIRLGDPVPCDNITLS